MSYYSNLEILGGDWVDVVYSERSRTVRTQLKEYKSILKIPLLCYTLIMQHRVSYIGKAEYCYSNSAAMLLSSIGENIRPEQIEVSAGIGLGAFLIKDTNLLYFSPLAIPPDVGLTKSLHILGFEFEERSFNQEEPPLEELKHVVKSSTVLIGPLDMGYLVYQKHQSPPRGADHYVLVYGIDSENIYLHDPYGYPNVFLTFEQLKPAWKAENIGYKLGFYHWWHSPKRITSPTPEDIYKQTFEHFKYIYQESDGTAHKNNRIINREAIKTVADKIEANELTSEEIGILTGFGLPLTAKRANDYANFFREFNPELAELKYKLSVLSGHSYVLLIEKKFNKAADKLRELAETEGIFKEKLLSQVQ